jgi:hypothetical protein
VSSARFGRVVQRWWLFIAAVTGATLAAAIVWQLVGPVGLRAEAELLLQLNLPEDSQSLQFGVESSRALASGVVIEDLARLTRGRELLRLAHAEVIDAGHTMDFRAMFEAIDVYPLSRGLRIELDWGDGPAAQALIENIVTLLIENQASYYPTLGEIGTLRLIDKTNMPERPPRALAALDVILKSGVALILAIAMALVADWRLNRLHEADVPELIDAPVIGRLP